MKESMQAPENVKEAGQKALRERTKRLSEMVNLNGPTWMLATELELLSQALWLKDPEGMAEHIAHQKAVSARINAGLCMAEFSCGERAVRGSECETHAKELDEFLAFTEEEVEGSRQ
jgi:hypothetical protein